MKLRIQLRGPKINNLGKGAPKNRSESSPHNGFIALGKISTVVGGDSLLVNTSSEHRSPFLRKTHVNNLSRRSKRNFSSRELMKPNLKVNPSSRKTRSLLEKRNEIRNRILSTHLKITRRQKSNGFRRAFAASPKRTSFGLIIKSEDARSIRSNLIRFHHWNRPAFRTDGKSPDSMIGPRSRRSRRSPSSPGLFGHSRPTIILHRSSNRSRRLKRRSGSSSFGRKTNSLSSSTEDAFKGILVRGLKHFGSSLAISH